MRGPYRRSYRLPVRWPIRCHGTGQEFTGMVRDATGRGMFIELGAPAPVLAQSQLSLELRPRGREAEPAAKAVGRVVWRGFNARYECHGLGIQLEDDVEFLAGWHEQACHQTADEA